MKRIIKYIFLSHRFKQCLCLLFFAGFSISSKADLEITSFSMEPIDQQTQLMTKAGAKLKLSPDINDAINNGIRVHLNYTVKLKQKAAYIFADSTLHSWTLTFSIKFHSLSNQYIVTAGNSTKVSHHLTINEALDEIASNLIITIPLSDFTLDDSKQYYLSNRITIDKDLLPNLLKIYASIKPSWSISGPWMSWPILIDSKPLESSK